MAHDPTDGARLATSDLRADDAPNAAALLDTAERAAGSDLVDEAERRRLVAFADDGARDPRWQAFLFHRDRQPVAYGGLVLPADPAGPAVGDAALLVDVPDRVVVLAAVLDHLAGTAAGAETDHLEVWFRRTSEDELAALATFGWSTVRQLAVLGRALPVVDEPGPTAPADVIVRSFRDGDDAEVVRVLAAAYAGTPDAGWDLDAFTTKRSWDWFRADDLLVAEADDGRLLGLHWLKRRDDVTGEVHNLAIDPATQGSGLGGVLLRAGLDHLAATGCDEVVLWVDRANQRAVRLYTALGFTTRWDDVALRPTPQQQP